MFWNDDYWKKKKEADEARRKALRDWQDKVKKEDAEKRRAAAERKKQAEAKKKKDAEARKMLEGELEQMSEKYSGKNDKDPKKQSTFMRSVMGASFGDNSTRMVGGGGSGSADSFTYNAQNALESLREESSRSNNPADATPRLRRPV